MIFKKTNTVSDLQVFPGVAICFDQNLSHWRGRILIYCGTHSSYLNERLSRSLALVRSPHRKYASNISHVQGPWVMNLNNSF